MKALTVLLKEGRPIAERHGVDTLFATTDGQYFLGEHYARLHAKNKAVNMHVLTYTADGDGSGAEVEQVKATPAVPVSTPLQAEGKLPTLSDVLKAIGSAKDAKELASAYEPTDTRTEVLSAVAQARKKLLAAPASVDLTDLTKVKGVGAATAEKLNGAGIVTIGDLAKADAKELSAETGINKTVLTRVIAEAKKHG